MNEEIKNEIQKLKKEKDAVILAQLLCRWGSAGDCRLCRRLLLSCRDCNQSSGEHDYFLWSLFHGRKCENPESKEASRNGRRSCRLSDGTHGRRR